MNYENILYIYEVLTEKKVQIVRKEVFEKNAHRVS